MRGKKIVGLILGLVLVMSMVLTACGGNNENASNNNAGNNNSNKSSNNNNSNDDSSDEGTKTEMDDEQYYTYVRGDDANTLDPHRAGDIPTWSIQAPIYEGLTRYAAVEGGAAEIQPGVAETWEVSEDGLTYTFYLREDAKWSDGSAVTAHDFVYGYQRVFDPVLASDYAWMITGIIKNGAELLEGKVKPEELGVVALDDYTVEFTLERPCAYFLILSGFPTYMPVKKDVVEQYGDAYGADIDKVVTNGPFTMTKWERGANIEYEPNEHYWDKENVHLDKVNAKIVQEPAPAAQALMAGEVDAAGISTPEWKNQLLQDERFQYSSDAGAGIEFFMFNLDNEYLQNTKIRQALAIGLDRDKFCADLGNGVTDPLYSAVPPIIAVGEELYYDRVNNENEYIKGLIEANPDPKALLIEGLKELGKPEDPSQVTLRLITRGTTEWAKKESEWIRQNYKETLGINIEIVMTEWNVMWDIVDQGDYEIAMGGWSADYNDPSTFLDIFHTKSGYYNENKTSWTGPKAEEYNSLIEQAQQEIDNQKRAELFLAAEKILVEEAVLVPRTGGSTSTFRGKYVKGFYSNPFTFQSYKGVYTQGR